MELWWAGGPWGASLGLSPRALPMAISPGTQQRTRPAWGEGWTRRQDSGSALHPGPRPPRPFPTSGLLAHSDLESAASAASSSLGDPDQNAASLCSRSPHEMRAEEPSCRTGRGHPGARILRVRSHAPSCAGHWAMGAGEGVQGWRQRGRWGAGSVRQQRASVWRSPTQEGSLCLQRPHQALDVAASGLGARTHGTCCRCP